MTRTKRIIFLLLGLACGLFFLRPLSAEVDVSTVTGNTIRFNATTGDAIVEGDAEVRNATATLKADTIKVNTQTKWGHAEGNVSVESASATITGSEATYNWATSTGTIQDAVGKSPPWNFQSKEMIQLSPDLFTLDEPRMTSCDEVPPHYSIRARHGTIRPGKRIKLYNARLVPDDTPSFWLPFYTKSLVPKKYRLRIEPGQSSRDGITNKTTLGYPFNDHSWTKFRWDYLQRTGNGGGLEHTYDTPTRKGVFDSYYIRDSNSDQEVPRSKRYTILWNHFQKLSSRLSLNSRVDLKSDQTFGNSFSGVGNEVKVENTQRGLLSEAGFVYQFPVATLQAQFDRRDKFNTAVSSHQFISKLTLPRLILNTAPLKGRYFPVYTSLTASFTNDTQERSDPKIQLFYKKNAVGGIEFKRDLKIGKKFNFTPLASYNQSWDSRVLSSTYVVTEEDQYTGRYTLGMDARRKLNRNLDLRLGYRYSSRNRLNQTLQDNEANDYGVEANQMTGSFQSRIGRSTLMTLSSGYDYRQDPRNDPGKYERTSSRVLPPSLDLQVELKKDVNLFFRETYSIFDERTGTPINTPVNTSGEIQLGNPIGATFFSQGFTYSKKGFGDDSQLFLNNKIKFYFTPKWYADIFISYRAVGESGIDYRKLFPIERGIRVARDMHCWLLRAEFINRPGRTDATFYIDLKSNMGIERDIFAQKQSSVYSTRNDGPDYGQIFPEVPEEPAQPEDSK